MLKKTVLIIVCLLLIVLGYELMRRNVGSFAGSYPFAESWRVDKSMLEIEANLKKLHSKNPAVFLGKDNLVFEDEPNGYWKRVDFFYGDRNEIVQVLFREFDNYTAVSLLKFVNKSSGEIRLMNRDFNWFANKKEKEIFESRILNYLDDK